MARVIKKAGASDNVELNEEALEYVDNEEVNTGEEGEEGEITDEVVEEEIAEAEAEEAKAPVAPVSVSEKVRLKNDLNCHIGGKFHQFTAGKVYSVEANVKSILKEAGYLEAL